MNKIKFAQKSKIPLLFKNQESTKLKYFSILIKTNEEKTKSELYQKHNKSRNPGIDLGRILATFGIIVHHILLHGNIFKKYPQYKDLYKLNTSFFWHVSTYIFISGYVGYKSTKYSNLLYLWFCTLFYTIGIIFRNVSLFTSFQ